MKRKADDSPSLWRAKCIERFQLKPVPEGWKDAVAGGTETAWKRYFEYRSQEEEKLSVYDPDHDDYCYDEPKCDFMKEWKAKMRSVTCREPWFSWTPKFGRLVWVDEDEYRTAEYYSHIWSPYAIPHALGLEHYYHHKVTSFIEFRSIWSYRMIDFEIDSSPTVECTELCSNHNDDVDTSNLKMATVNKLRRFLFGSDSEESKIILCDNHRFLGILFGSMGTMKLVSDTMGDMGNVYLGYVWSPDEELRKKLFEEGVSADDCPDDDDEPPESFDYYNPREISWLEHRVMEITGTLGPVSTHYEHPKKKKEPSRTLTPQQFQQQAGGLIDMMEMITNEGKSEEERNDKESSKRFEEARAVLKSYAANGDAVAALQTLEDLKKK
ncbi:unnamed protein product [Cylindrotheca closterium]|uniref:Uncharacterized protein n=1 Tax=Cylindrotheca closterium TaxID=2856 RepID=A0AAD2CLH0_9STRA|nr:unnamed protein product [Cylindrotheca closterium]